MSFTRIGMPCSGPRDPPGSSLGVEFFRRVTASRIERDHRVEGRTLLVVRLDAREIDLDEPAAT